MGPGWAGLGRTRAREHRAAPAAQPATQCVTRRRAGAGALTCTPHNGADERQAVERIEGVGRRRRGHSPKDWAEGGRVVVVVVGVAASGSMAVAVVAMVVVAADRRAS